LHVRSIYIRICLIFIFSCEYLCMYTYIHICNMYTYIYTSICLYFCFLRNWHPEKRTRFFSRQCLVQADSRKHDSDVTKRHIWIYRRKMWRFQGRVPHKFETHSQGQNVMNVTKLVMNATKFICIRSWWRRFYCFVTK